MSAYAVAGPRGAVPESLVIRIQRDGNRLRAPQGHRPFPLTLYRSRSRMAKASAGHAWCTPAASNASGQVGDAAARG
jgi:hypothetical protein